MPRPTIDLEPYKAEINVLYQRNEPVAVIQDYPKESFDLQLSKRTLESHFQEWGLLHRDHTVLFFQVGLEDKDIIHVLHQEEVTLASCTLRCMRKSLGLVRRTESLFERQYQTEAILQALLEESEKGKIQGFGEYIVPGLNYLWPVDGYMKLEPVLNQFLDIIETVQLQPQKIRSDHGPERDCLQDIYLQLQQAYDPSIQKTDCCIEGRSTKNQRIEAWWEQLSKSLFSKSYTTNQIALLSIYMPMIHTEIYGYVEHWNIWPPPLQLEDETAPFHIIYLELREIISFHINLFVKLFLGLSS
ncbi:hypothetical protein BDV29DRAFT_191850 [Aspergillus leporis]|uniref:Uncharacterized protein n=1 Tax=Aspergillus leporis TaxID=41062 RepID=A0A5N5WXU4_9EURO|nr:hypothetical protein BDV29DRAFT_191850 [Aspergillus leporis]